MAPAWIVCSTSSSSKEEGITTGSLHRVSFNRQTASTPLLPGNGPWPVHGHYGFVFHYQGLPPTHFGSNRLLPRVQHPVRRATTITVQTNCVPRGTKSWNWDRNSSFGVSNLPGVWFFDSIYDLRPNGFHVVKPSRLVNHSLGSIATKLLLLHVLLHHAESDAR